MNSTSPPTAPAFQLPSSTATSSLPAVELDALRRLQGELLQAVTSGGAKEQVLAKMASTISQVAGDVALFDFRRDDEQKLTLAARIAPGGLLPSNDQLQEKLLADCNAACQQGCLQIEPVGKLGDFLCYSAPVFLRKRAPEAISMVVQTSLCPTEQAAMLLPLVVVYITLWHVLQDSSETDSEVQTFAALLDLLQRLATAPNLQYGCFTLVGELQQYLGCRRVALGLLPGGRGDCRLEALSESAKFDKRSQFVCTVEAALDESILRESVTVWPPNDESQRHSVLAHQKLCNSAEFECVVSSPLLDDQGEPVGAWLFLGDKKSLQQPATLALFQAAQRPFGTSLQLLQRADASVGTRLWRSIRDISRSWKFKTALIGTCLLAIVMALPFSYKIGCDCVLQPVTRRFVAAPYDATLDKSLVAPGDVVTKGKILARIDGRDIRLELAGLIADRDRAAKEHDSALASQNASKAQLAKLEMQRLQLNIRLLENHVANLEIKSPVDGIVITGDLEKAEGAPLTTGQTMFEIAPLEKMSVEVSLPEEEISYARRGMHVEIRLDAYPGRVWRTMVAKIHPRSEIRDNQSVFVTELTLDNPNGLLRPGMKGQAKIVGKKRALAWNLFHKPWEYLLRVIGW